MGIGYDFVNYDIYNVSKNPNATSSNAIYQLDFNTSVDIVLQNANTVTPTIVRHIHGISMGTIHGISMDTVFGYYWTMEKASLTCTKTEIQFGEYSASSYLWLDYS